MKILVINCSPVRNGATAEIVRLVSEFCGKSNEIRAVCIDDYEIKLCRAAGNATRARNAQFWTTQKN